MSRRCQLILTFCALLAVPCSTIAAEDLSAAIQKVIEAPKFNHAQWGILAVDLMNGTVLFEHEADKLLAPASTTKLFSVATALGILGADYCFRTPVHRRGDVDDDGVLRGDLVLVASGDLTMGGRTTAEGTIAYTDHDHTYASLDSHADLTAPDPLSGLEELAQQIASSGIRRVEGDVLIDDRLFEHTLSTGSGPTQVAPIRINDNLFDITITPSKVGEPAEVTWRPHTMTYTFDVQVDTIPTGGRQQVQVDRLGKGRLRIRGRVSADSKPVLIVHEAHHAASFARSLFIEALARAGVRVEASPLEENHADQLPSREEIGALPVVATLVSPPFAEDAKLILKVSHNLNASTLPLLVASKYGDRTLAAGLKHQGKFLRDLGVAVETISFGGGAGGSAADFTTPRVTVQLLVAMSKRQDFAAFRDALPILGVDGTLASAVAKDSPVRGHAQAKTGTYFHSDLMNGGFILTSKALAGYLTTKSGRPLAFAAMVNKVHLKKASERNDIGKTLGQICEILYDDHGR